MVADCGVARLPKIFPGSGIRELLVVEIFRMHLHHQHLFVVAAIEDPDPPPFRQAAGGAPEEVVIQLLGGGLFEGEHLAAGGIDPAHYRADGTVLAGGIHRLEHQEQGVFVVGIEHPLQLVQLVNIFFQMLFTFFLIRRIFRRNGR